MMKETGEGVYFHPETGEILRVGDRDPDPGDGWIRISEDSSLGLLAARRRVKDLGLAEDATAVEWFGMRGGSLEAVEDMSRLVCRFKRDSEESRTEVDGGSGLLGRLGARLKSIVGGSSGDGGHASPLAAVPVRVRYTDSRLPIPLHKPDAAGRRQGGPRSSGTHRPSDPCCLRSNLSS
ncbi:MAG: hypothetical protein V3U63_03230 [Gemmatimonadota bacterium]